MINTILGVLLGLLGILFMVGPMVALSMFLRWRGAVAELALLKSGYEDVSRALDLVIEERDELFDELVAYQAPGKLLEEFTGRCDKIDGDDATVTLFADPYPMTGTYEANALHKAGVGVGDLFRLRTFKRLGGVYCEIVRLTDAVFGGGSEV